MVEKNPVNPQYPCLSSRAQSRYQCNFMPQISQIKRIDANFSLKSILNDLICLKWSKKILVNPQYPCLSSRAQSRDTSHFSNSFTFSYTRVLSNPFRNKKSQNFFRFFNSLVSLMASQYRSASV